MIADRDLQHSAITQIERYGYPLSQLQTQEQVLYKCSSCGATIAEQQSAYHLCESCESKALARFKYFLCNEFTENEREYLDACIEGNSLTEIEKIKDIKAVIV